MLHIRPCWDMTPTHKFVLLWQEHRELTYEKHTRTQRFSMYKQHKSLYVIHIIIKVIRLHTAITATTRHGINILNCEITLFPWKWEINSEIVCKRQWFCDASANCITVGCIIKCRFFCQFSLVPAKNLHYHHTVRPTINT